MERCCLHVKQSVWWLGISEHLTEAFAKCLECTRDASQTREPPMPTPLLAYPWQVIGSDLFMLNGSTYLLVVDYYSTFSEVPKISSTVSRSVISVLKALFVRYGIPKVLQSNNCPQYSSDEFAQFIAVLRCETHHQ